MLQDLINVPRTPEEWHIWAFSHADHHFLIRQAIRKEKNVSLFDYQVYPLDFGNIGYFLQRNQQLHNDMNSTSGTQGQDLQQVDFNDKNQVEAWIQNHFLEHQSVANQLKI